MSQTKYQDFVVTDCEIQVISEPIFAIYEELIKSVKN
jgi:hypothetical protein